MPIARDVIVVKVRVLHVTARGLPQVKDGQGHFGVGQAFRKNVHVPLPCLKTKTTSLYWASNRMFLSRKHSQANLGHNN